eukprot:2540017-Amphidinium_carterae.1
MIEAVLVRMAPGPTQPSTDKILRTFCKVGHNWKVSRFLQNLPMNGLWMVYGFNSFSSVTTTTNAQTEQPTIEQNANFRDA